MRAVTRNDIDRAARGDTSIRIWVNWADAWPDAFWCGDTYSPDLLDGDGSPDSNARHPDWQRPEDLQNERAFLARLLQAYPSVQLLDRKRLKHTPDSKYSAFDFALSNEGAKWCLLEYKRIGHPRGTYDHELMPVDKYEKLTEVAKLEKMQAGYAVEYGDGSCWRIWFSELPQELEVRDIARRDREEHGAIPHVCIPLDSFQQIPGLGAL